MSGWPGLASRASCDGRGESRTTPPGTFVHGAFWAVRWQRAAVMVIVVGRSAAGAMAGGVHGFAPALTSFVGRAEAVAKVAGLVGERRLVTVTGPGGSGKSRLAAEVAKQVGSRFADGVWLVELAAARDPAQVPSVVAAVLGARERPEEPAADAVARVLAGQQLLLMLDNCEHVAGAAAELCAGLLPAADDVRVLATSREPLRVAGEARYRLAPLALPDLDDPAHGAGAESVVLFAAFPGGAMALFRSISFDLAQRWNSLVATRPGWPGDPSAQEAVATPGRRRARPG